MPSEAVSYRHAIAKARLASRGHSSMTPSQRLQVRRPVGLRPFQHLRAAGAASTRQRDTGDEKSIVQTSQRRHASNVPGPLEARRRLAKRRMAMAMPGASQEANTLSSWWLDMRRLVKAAQMSLGTEVFPWEDLHWSPPWTTPSLSPGTQSTAPCLERVPQVQTGIQDSKTMENGNADSTRPVAFTATIDQCNSLRDLRNVCSTIATLGECCEEASSQALAHLLSRQAYWHQRHDVDWSTDLTSILTACFFHIGQDGSRDPSVMDWTTRLINCCTAHDQLRSILPVWLTSLRHVGHAGQRTATWEHMVLRALRENPRARQDISGITSRAEGLAPPQEIAHCFSGLDSVALGRLSVIGSLYHLPQEAKQRQKVMARYDRYAGKGSADAMQRTITALIQSAKAMDEHTTWRLWSWVYIITYKSGGEQKLLELLECARAQKSRADWIGPPMTRLLRLLARSDPIAAMRIFRAGRFYINDPSPIIAELMEHEHIPASDIMYMMWHGQRLDRVRGNATGERCRLSAGRVQLISNMALKFSGRACDSPRKAYRNVQHCYRYLVDHGGPVTKEIAEALCISGVIRTLQAREWLSTGKFAWILNVVKEAEGPETAERLDRLTYRWREQVKRHVVQERRRRFRQGDRLVTSVTWVKVPRRRFGVEIGDLRRRAAQPAWKPLFMRVPRRKLIWVSAERQ